MWASGNRGTIGFVREGVRAQIRELEGRPVLALWMEIQIQRITR
jgi:hypothetical protein